MPKPMGASMALDGKIIQNKFSYVKFSYYIYTMHTKPDPDKLMAWALKRLGPSKCKRIQLVNRPNWTFYGDWNWDGTIRINIGRIGYRKQLYRVLAHEWTHAQQYWRDYKKYLFDYEYWHHPLEVEARQREKLMDYRIPKWLK